MESKASFMLGEHLDYWTTSSTTKLFQLLQFCVHFRIVIHLVLLVLSRNALTIQESFVVLYEFWDCFFYFFGGKKQKQKKSTIYDYSALSVVDIIWGESIIFSMIELNL